MPGKNFDEIVKAKFKFLQSSFGFGKAECKKENWGYEIIYLNKTTGVQVVYEYRVAYIFITLYKLVNGILLKNSLPISNNSILTGFGLDDIILLRNAAAIIHPSYHYNNKSEYFDEENGFELYIQAFANNLKDYATDVLSGNFEIFEEIEKIVKKRAIDYNSQR